MSKLPHGFNQFSDRIQDIDFTSGLCFESGTGWDCLLKQGWSFPSLYSEHNCQRCEICETRKEMIEALNSVIKVDCSTCPKRNSC